MTLEEQYINLENRIQRLNNISLALSRENDINLIFELILDEAKHITNADGRTLYMKSNDGNSMNFEILQTDSMKIRMGGTSGVNITFPNIALYNREAKPNMNNINTYVAHTGKTLNIVDAYKEEGPHQYHTLATFGRDNIAYCGRLHGMPDQPCRGSDQHHGKNPLERDVPDP